MIVKRASVLTEASDCWVCTRRDAPEHPLYDVWLGWGDAGSGGKERPIAVLCDKCLVWLGEEIERERCEVMGENSTEMER